MVPMRRRLRWARLACFALALLLALVGVVSPGAAQTDDDRPAAFTGFAYAAAVQITGNTQPPQAIPEILRLDIPYGQSTFGSGSLSRAQASVVFPGAVGELPSFFCTLGFPCDQFQVPTWPLNANAEYPGRPDAEPDVASQSVESPAFTIQPAIARAHAGRDFVETFATGADMAFLEVLPEGPDGSTALLHVEELVARTRHEFDDQGVLVSTARSRLSGVSLLAGAIKIDSIVSTSISRSDGNEVLTAEPTVEVAGVTFAGQAAEITSDGLEVGGERPLSGTPLAGYDLNVLFPALAQLLSSGGFDVRLVDDKSSTDDNKAIGDAVGLVVDYKIDGSGLPNGAALVGNLVLGAARTNANASSFSFGDGGPSLPPLPAAPVGGGDPTTLPDSFTNTGGSVDSGAPVGGGSAPVPGEAPAAEGGSERAAGPLNLLSGLAADRITWFYLAWALGMLGLALGSRLPWARIRPEST